MRYWQAVCDCGDTGPRRTSAAVAQRDLHRHVCVARLADLRDVDESTVEGRIHTHRWLAVKLARSYSRRGRAYDDAYADALIGLWKASQAFDPERGIKFSTYAAHRINGEMRDGAREDLQFGRYAFEHGVPQPLSIDAVIELPRGDVSLAETLADPSDDFTVWWDAYDRGDERGRLAHAMDARGWRDERERDIIAAHLLGETLKSIGERLDITESRVCQIVSRWRLEVARLVA